MRSTPFVRCARGAAVLLLFSLSACDSFATDPGANEGGLPPGAVGQILLQNQSSDLMTGVYFAPCGQSSNENRGSVGAGQTRAWTVTPGCYDVRAVASTGTWGPTRGDVPSSGTLTVTFTD